MLDIGQYRALVVRPTIAALGLWSAAAERLVTGTALVESRLTYLKQLGAGPALGLNETEPASHRDLYANFLRYHPTLLNKVTAFVVTGQDLDGQLVWNLAYAAAVCRLIYYRQPEKLPAADDLAGLGSYWKRYYNTAGGAGDPAVFVNLCRINGV